MKHQVSPPPQGPSHPPPKGPCGTVQADGLSTRDDKKSDQSLKLATHKERDGADEVREPADAVRRVFLRLEKKRGGREEGTGKKLVP